MWDLLKDLAQVLAMIASFAILAYVLLTDEDEDEDDLP